MICSPLKQLIDWCAGHEVFVSRSDLVRITCGDCRQQETCPAGIVPGIEESEPGATEPLRKPG